MHTRISYSIKHLKSRKIRNFFVHCLGKISNSQPTENTISSIVCVGIGKAGKINALLTSQMHEEGVKRAKKVGFGELTQIGDSEYQTVIINGLWTMNALLIGCGSWNKRTLYGTGEPSFTGSKIVGTQKL